MRTPAILVRGSQPDGQSEADKTIRGNCRPSSDASASTSQSLCTSTLAQRNATKPCSILEDSIAPVMVINRRPLLLKFPLLLANFSASDCIDPFNSTALPLDKTVQPVLQHYLDSVSVPSYRLCLSKSCLTERSHTAISDLFRGSLYDKMHLYSLLSVTAARMNRVFRVDFDQKTNPEYFNYKAIGCLRDYLSSVDKMFDKTALLDIYYLCIYEWYMHNYNAARMHLVFISHFWDSMSIASSDFDHYIHDMVSYNDVFLAVEMNAVPILALNWEPESFSDARMAEIRLEIDKAMATLYSSSRPSDDKFGPAQIMGSGLIDAAQADTFCQGMTVVLFDMVSLFQVARYTQIFPVTSAAEVQWVSRKSQALIHRLLSIVYDGYEDCVRITLLIILTFISAPKIWRNGKVDLSKLAKRLRVRLKHFWDGAEYFGAQNTGINPSAESPIWLWICLTGAFSAEDVRDDQEWFLTQGARIARSMTMKTNVKLQEVLESYVFFENMQGTCLRQLILRLSTSTT
jgi:hypothetical protein